MEKTAIDVLEFKIGHQLFGIDLKKVVEIIPYRESLKIHKSNQCIEGVYLFRDELVTIIDMVKVIPIAKKKEDNSNMIIVIKINGELLGLHVDSVSGIHNAAENERIEPVDDFINDIVCKDIKELFTATICSENQKIYIVNEDNMIDRLKGHITLL